MSDLRSVNQNYCSEIILALDKHWSFISENLEDDMKVTWAASVIATDKLFVLKTDNK